MAVRLLHGEGLTYDGSNPSVCRAPAYPAYLAAVMFITGENPIPYTLLRISDSLLDSLTAASLLWLCAVFFPFSSRRTRILAGVLYAFNPFVMYYTLKMGPETLILPFFVIYLGLLHKLMFDSENRWRNAALLGLVSGILLLNKSVFIPFIILSPLVIIGIAPKSRKSSVIPPILISLMLAFTILAPWSLRCNRYAGRFVLVQTLTGYNFWYDFVIDENRNANFAAGRLDDCIFEEGKVKSNEGVPFEPYHLAAWDEASIDRDLVVRARTWIRQNPIGFLRKTADNFFSFWYVVETPKKMVVTGLFSLLFLLTTFSGTYRLCRYGHGRSALILLILILLVDLIYVPVISLYRYSLIVYPMMTLLTAFTVTELLDRWKLRS
jgi:4-amino-4-deoxy-L-arabinose transferase-like glycosyltransferase